jgi:hypothetical protein
MFQIGSQVTGCGNKKHEAIKYDILIGRSHKGTLNNLVAFELRENPLSVRIYIFDENNPKEMSPIGLQVIVLINTLHIVDQFKVNQG